VNPGAASRLTAGGTASVAGTLALTFDPGEYSERRYTLVSGTAREGTFGAVAQAGEPGPFLIPTIEYTPTEVDLLLSIEPSPSVGPPSFLRPAETPNQMAVGMMLDSAFPTASGDMVTVFGALLALETDAQARAAYDQISGVVYTTVPTVALDNAQMVSGLVFRQLDNVELLAAAQGPDQPIPAGPWASLLGDTDTYTGDGNAPGFSSQTYGALLGYDQPIKPGLSWGGLLGTWHKTVSLNETGAWASLTSVLLGLYGGYTTGPWVVHGIVGYTFDSDTGTRPLEFGPLSRTATSSFNPNEVLAAVEGGYRYQSGGVTLTPALGLQYAHINVPGFTEQGAGALDLTVAGAGTDSLQGLAGVRATYISPTTEGGHPVKVTGYAVYSHEFDDTSRRINVQLAGAPAAPFIIAGVSPARDGVRVGASVGAMVSDTVEVSGGYDVLWSSNQTFQTYQLSVKVHF